MHPGKIADIGQLFIVSGPSGSGKTTLCQSLLKGIGGLEFSVSFTTRVPREDEVHGVDYYFVTIQEFKEMQDRGAFLEWARVYDNYYGTGKEAVQKVLNSGKDVLLDIDVQGARQVRERVPQAISILIFPPSFQVLRSRLENRGKDTAEVIARRLCVAQEELGHFPDYDFVVINDDYDRAMAEIRNIVNACRCRTARRAAWAEAMLKSFMEVGS